MLTLEQKQELVEACPDRILELDEITGNLVAVENAYEMATKEMSSQSCNTAAFTEMASATLVKSSLLVCVACRVAAKPLTVMAISCALKLPMIGIAAFATASNYSG